MRRFLEPMRDVGIHHVFAQIAFVLAFDKQRVEDNLERIYGIEHMPGDTQMRERPRSGVACLAAAPYASASLGNSSAARKRLQGNERECL